MFRGLLNKAAAQALKRITHLAHTFHLLEENSVRQQRKCAGAPEAYREGVYECAGRKTRSNLAYSWL